MAWTLIFPPGQQPDEPAHASYVDAIANDFSLRPQPRIYTEGLDEALRASNAGRLQFHPERSIAFAPGSLEVRREQIERSRTLRSEINVGHAKSAASSYPPLYYAVTSIAVRITPDVRYDTTIYLMRAMSVLLASVTIVVQFAVLLAIFESVARAGIAAFVLTMMPMYTSMESAVNPDVLITLFGSISLLLALRLLETPFRLRLHALSGLVIALSLLAKPNSIVFVLPYVGAAIGGAIRKRPDFTWRSVFGGAGAFLAPAVLVYGGWRAWFPPVRDAVSATGGWPAFDISSTALQAFGNRVLSQFEWRFNDLYWGTFGWADAPMPLAALKLGLVVGAAVMVIVLLSAINGAIPSKIWLCLGAVGSILAMVLFVEYMSVLGELAGDELMAGGFIQGRYFFPFVVAIVAIQMWALDTALVRRWRLRLALWCIAPFVVGVMQLIAVLDVVVPRYFL